MRARVAVVATGIVSPLGPGRNPTLEGLREARDCVSPVRSFPVDQCRCQTAGQVDDEWVQALLPHDRRSRRLHRSSGMLIAALRELLDQAPGFQPQLTVIGTTSGGMSFGERYYRALGEEAARPRREPEWIANYPPQKPVLDALEAFGQTTPCQVVANRPRTA